MRMNKKAVLCIVCCIVLFWCCRIYSINQIRGNEYQIQMGEELQGENISIVPLEAHLFSRYDFLEYFHLTEDVLNENENENCKFICVCLLVSNVTEQDISWDLVMNATSCGFETKTWASTNMSYIGSKLNVFEDECLRANQSQKIWYVTVVNPICFKDKTWGQLECKDFCYVLSLTPEKINVQLE